MLEIHHNINKVGSAQAERIVEKILMDLKNHVNQNVASFSRIHKIVEQREPFEKTPTQKIKRFLYQ